VIDDNLRYRYEHCVSYVKDRYSCIGDNLRYRLNRRYETLCFSYVKDRYRG